MQTCQQKKVTEDGYSDAFKPVLDTVSVLFVTNRLDNGLNYLDSAIKHINRPTLDDRFRVCAFHYIFEQKAKGDNKKALLYADTMLTIAEQNVNDKQYVSNYAEANFAIGDAYFSMQQFDDAYQHYFNGYNAGKHFLNNVVLADYAYRLGMIVYKMGNYKLAATYFKNSYNLHTQTRDKFADFYRQQEVLDNIALSYKHNGDIDSSIAYFDRALAYINKTGPQFTDRLKMIDIARGVVYGNKAEVLIIKGDDAHAKDMLRKSIAINLKKTYDNNDAELAEIKLAQLYYDHNENDALFKLLNTIKLQFDSVKNMDAFANWNRLMSSYYQRKHNLQKAINYLQTYNAVKDSIIQKLNLLRESDVNKQFDTYVQQQQIDTLSNNNKIQKIYLYAITILVAMTLSIILLIYRNWLRAKKDVLKVKALNNQINEQNIALGNALNELKLNSREKDRILRAVAHDLRNPLGGIAALTSLMAESEYNNDEQREQVNLVRETAYNALEMINEILDAANVSTTTLNMEMVNVNQLVSYSVELLRFKAAEKRQEIYFKPLAEEKELYLSREKIGRVISNLISNAIKFSPSGAAIYVNVTQKDKQIVIAVEDNGIGIPEKLKDTVFNMFTTAQRPGTAGEKSFGLGLSICRQIIDQFDGKIWFEDNKNGGTIFYVSLPLPVPNTKKPLTQKVGVPVS